MKKLSYILIVLTCVSFDASAQAEFLKGNTSGVAALYSIGASQGGLSHALSAGVGIYGRANLGATAASAHGYDDPNLAFFLELFPVKQSRAGKLAYDDELGGGGRETHISWGIGVSLGRSDQEVQFGLATQLCRRIDFSRFVFLQPAFRAALGGIGSKTKTTSVGANLTLGLGDDKDHLWWLLGVGASVTELKYKIWTGYYRSSWESAIDFSLGLVIPFKPVAD